MTNFCTANQQQHFHRYFQQHNDNNNNDDSDNKNDDIVGDILNNIDGNCNNRIAEQQRRVDSLKQKLLLFDGIDGFSEMAAESPFYRCKKDSAAFDDAIDIDTVFDDDTDGAEGGVVRQQPQLMSNSSRQLRMIFSSESVAFIQISKTGQSHRKKIESLSRFTVSPTPNALPATTAATVASSTTRPLRVIVSNSGSGNSAEACPIAANVGSIIANSSTSPSSSIDSGLCSPAPVTFDHNHIQHHHSCNYRLNGANTATTTTTSSSNASSSPPLRPHYSAFFLYGNSGCESAFHHNPYHMQNTTTAGGHQHNHHHHHHHHHIRTSAPCCFPAVSGFPLIANSSGNSNYSGQQLEASGCSHNHYNAITTITSTCIHYTNNKAGNHMDSLTGFCQPHCSTKLSAASSVFLQSQVLPPLNEIHNEDESSYGRAKSPHLFQHSCGIDNTITTSPLTGGLKGILKKSNIHTCAANATAAEDLQLWKDARRHQLLRSVSESASSDFIVEKENGLMHAFSGMMLNSSSKFTMLSEDVGGGESALPLQFYDDDEFSKTSFEETTNNANSSGHSDSSFNADSSDEKIGDIAPRKKRVSFSEHVQARIYRSNSSILGQKKRTERKNRQKRRRSESENCNAAENNVFNKQLYMETDKKTISSDNDDDNNCHICGKLLDNFSIPKKTDTNGKELDDDQTHVLSDCRRRDSGIENDAEEEKSTSTDEVDKDEEAENEAAGALEGVSICADCHSALTKKKRVVGDDKLAKRMKRLVSADSALGEEETTTDVNSE